MNNPEAFKEDEVRSIKFVVPGLPFGKQRPKVTVRKFTGSDGKEKKFAKAYTPEKTVNYENLVKMAYQEKAKGKKFKDGDMLDVRIIAYYNIPPSTSKKRRTMMLEHKIRPTKKPDWDNIGKIVCDSLNNIAYMIESFVGKEIMEEPLEQYDKMLSPAVQFDFKNVTFTFLPHQVNDMDILVKDLESKAPEIVGVASYEQCKAFVETLSKYQKFTDIRNVGAAIHSMIENANEKMDAVGFNAEEEWTYLAKVFGSNAIPADAAEVIKQAIKKAEKEGTITSKNRWQLIEYLCADYLGK